MIGTPFANKEWRLEHCYKIVDKQSQLRTLRLNVVQQAVRECLNPRQMILKARQMGVSTYGLIDIYDDTVTKPNLTSAIIAHKQDVIEKLFRIPKRAWEFSHPKLRPVIDRGGGSKYEMFFPKLNSRIYCDIEVRGDTIHEAHFSEFAFMDQARAKATLQAVPLEGGRVRIESTANGVGGLFYDMWHDKKQPYAKLFFPWFVFPEYQIPVPKLVPGLSTEEKEFCKKAKKHFGIDITIAQIAYRRFKQVELADMFIQEYPEDAETCFLASGSAAMDLLKLQELMLRSAPPLSEDGPTRIYRKYNNAHFYACGVDTAEGVGADWSRACMYDVNDWEQVATLNCRRHSPADFAEALFAFCHRFTERGRPLPLLGVERNNHGHAVLMRLEEKLYPNLFFRKTGTDERGNQLRDERPGWVTDKVTRPLMLDMWIDAVQKERLRLNDVDTFSECRTLINNEGKIEAQEGKHDDTVIAAAIGLQMVLELAVLSVYENIGAKIRV
jgi:hypothetical protein